MKVKVKRQFSIDGQTYYPAGTFEANGTPRPDTVEIESNDLAIHVCDQGWAELVKPPESKSTPQLKPAVEKNPAGGKD